MQGVSGVFFLGLRSFSDAILLRGRPQNQALQPINYPVDQNVASLNCTRNDASVCATRVVAVMGCIHLPYSRVTDSSLNCRSQDESAIAQLPRRATYVYVCGVGLGGASVVVVPMPQEVLTSLAEDRLG